MRSKSACSPRLARSAFHLWQAALGRRVALASDASPRPSLVWQVGSYTMSISEYPMIVSGVGMDQGESTGCPNGKPECGLEPSCHPCAYADVEEDETGAEAEGGRR